MLSSPGRSLFVSFRLNRDDRWDIWAKKSRHYGRVQGVGGIGARAGVRGV